MLTERQLSILHSIIQIYTATGVPVGSKTLMQSGISASSATIRNDMMILENQGLIQKTHSSSGRIPSPMGYRYYVDYLLTPEEVSKEELNDIHHFFSQRFYAVDEVIEKTAKELSKLTSYTAFSSSPEMKERRLVEFRIVPLRNHQVIAVVVTDRGNSESHIFQLPEMVEGEDVEKMFRVINDQLVGQVLSEVYRKLHSEIPEILKRYFAFPEDVREFFDLILSQAFEDRFFVSGRMNLLDFGSVTDIHQFKSIYSLMSDVELMAEFMVPSNRDFDIKIGTELENDLLKDLTLISTTYEVAGYGKGTIALLGPSNMLYSKTIGLLDIFRKGLSAELTQYYRTFDERTSLH